MFDTLVRELSDGEELVLVMDGGRTPEHLVDPRERTLGGPRFALDDDNLAERRQS
jgi:hypothetical protein